MAFPAVAPAQITAFTGDNNADAPVSFAGNAIDGLMPLSSSQAGSQITAVNDVPPQNLGSFNIVIVPGSGLSANAAALAAFNRAASSWMARISDPITVTINADLGALGAGVIGSTSSVILQAGYNTIRNQMVADAVGQPNNGIVASLPTAAQFTAIVPSGVSLTGNVLGTKANLKAMGFSGLDGAFGASDATMTFSTGFAFDFNRADGVTAGTVDFETVAAHEIGHALGFFSIVDSIVGGSTSVSPTTLDLFRFGNNIAGQDPSTSGEFTTFARNLVPGVDAITDSITDPEHRMSTGLTGAGTDGHQASHWKADELTGEFIGIMDPTLATGVAYDPQDADFRALDLIGYDVVAVPEPGMVSLIVLGGVVLGAARRR